LAHPIVEDGVDWAGDRRELIDNDSPGISGQMPVSKGLAAPAIVDGLLGCVELQSELPQCGRKLGRADVGEPSVEAGGNGVLASSGVDAEEVGGVAGRAASRPLDQRYGCGAANGRDAESALQGCQVSLIPVVFEKRRDVFGAVTLGVEWSFSSSIAGALKRACEGFSSLEQGF